MLISKEHGLNPGLEQCYFCMKDVGVILWGHNRGKEAPRRACVNLDPCSKCAELMKRGVILVSIRDGEFEDVHSSKQPPNPYRTGGWVVVTEDAVIRMLGDFAPGLLQLRFGFIEDSAWDKLGFPRTKEEAQRLGAETVEDGE
jgi:hypothetical protein